MIARGDSVELYCPLLAESLGSALTEPEMSLSLIPLQFIIMFCVAIIHNIVMQQKVAVCTAATHNSSFILLHAHHSPLSVDSVFAPLAASPFD